MMLQQQLHDGVKSSVQVSAEVMLAYVEQGDRQGEPLILLHGFSDSSFSYSRVLPRFSPRYHIFALDQRGHGDSSKDAPSFTIQDMVDDVLAFMDAQGLDQATVVGHSLGSMVAQKVASQAPTRVARLVLIGAFISGESEAATALHEVTQALSEPIDLDFVREFQSGSIHRSVPSDFFEQVVEESTKLPVHAWQAFADDFVLQDTRPDLPLIQAPTLIIWGDQESTVPWRDQQTLVERLPHATLLVYEQTGHTPQWEVPDQFVADLEEFLRKTPA